MRISRYYNFIPENSALPNAKGIGVYDSKGKRVGGFGLQNLSFPNIGKKLYSFGAISDVHLRYDTAQEDFQKALTFFESKENVDFVCVAGDLTASGTAEELTEYKTYVETYSPNTPVHSITGNHECWGGLNLVNVIANYTGSPLNYSFANGNDVFIMVGIVGDGEGGLFAQGTLQWLYETLENNRNKRCFVFQHVRPQDGCGNAYGIYEYDIWGGTESIVFENLMKHYHNSILFHGHSHLKFDLQTSENKANYDNLFGCHSIHIPSLSVPRSGDASGASSRKEIYADSEGYVVDVYPNHIILRGRNFVKEEFLPIATYCLDTTLKKIEAGTFVDSTGTIKI